MRLIYSVFDRKSQAYGPLVSAAHDAVATRDFVAACQEPQSQLAKFADDFELHCLGQFYDTTFDGVKETEMGLTPMFDPNAQRVIGAASPRVVITASAVRALHSSPPQEGPQRG